MKPNEKVMETVLVCDLDASSSPSKWTEKVLRLEDRSPVFIFQAVDGHIFGADEDRIYTSLIELAENCLSEK